jgi:hypothetical protein
MNNTEYIQELLHYLINEREKIEHTGLPIDHDLIKVYDYINDGIQTLNLMLFKVEYKDVRDRLAEENDCSSEIIGWDN